MSPWVGPIVAAFLVAVWLVTAVDLWTHHWLWKRWIAFWERVKDYGSTLRHHAFCLRRDVIIKFDEAHGVRVECRNCLWQSKGWQ